jgi:hypothetical protein
VGGHDRGEGARAMSLPRLFLSTATRRCGGPARGSICRIEVPEACEE